MPTYERKVIEQFADRLYSRANSLLLLYTIGGTIAGFVAGSLAGSSTNTAALVLMVIGGVAGAVAGDGRGIALRLQAQMALCQVQIEANSAAAVTQLTLWREEGEAARL